MESHWLTHLQDIISTHEKTGSKSPPTVNTLRISPAQRCLKHAQGTFLIEIRAKLSVLNEHGRVFIDSIEAFDVAYVELFSFSKFL